MKFKVGDRVIINDDEHGEIVSVDSRIIYPYEVKSKFDLARYSEDMLKLVQPEVQEPVPGKFYRTKDGNKMFYIGKDNYGYFVYQNKNGDFYQYSTATEHVSGCGHMEDIIGEWVDEVVLPAVEIKAYALVAKTDFLPEEGGWKRGQVMSIRPSNPTIVNPDIEEIVELTGTLPERKI